MRRSSGRIAVTLVTLLLGFLVVVQLRAQSTEGGLGNLSTQDLTILIANLNTRNGQLATEIAALERQRASLQSSVDRGETTAGQIRSDLGRVQAWAGLVPVAGPGISVAVAGPIAPNAVAQLLNELRNAGAEAIAVGDVRIVTGVAVGGSVDDLQVGGRSVASPLVIRVIGQPETMVGSLTRIGGPIAQIGARYPDVLITVSPQERLELPATDRSLMPDLARPRL
jgi:uncharacterized protein YlxW (UPF0749 family)